MTQARREESARPTTDTSDNPMCACCQPSAQPLEKPSGNETNWRCPVTGTQYTYDAATGAVEEVSSVNRQPAATEDDELFPQQSTRRAARQVRPNEDRFA